MIVKPMIRNNICLNAHPAGCAQEVENQIAFVKAQNAKRGRKPGAPVSGGTHPNGPVKAALILGCSTGYGLASRITASFGYGAATVGVSFEKEASEAKSGTPGWYNNLAFDRAARREGIPTHTINADAFSNATRDLVIAKAKEMGLVFDLVVYSLASPVRTDPETGVLYRSVLKPFGKSYDGLTVDTMTGKISTMTAEPATETEAAETIKVMGGEDWALWIDALSSASLLAPGCTTVAYSYIGPTHTHAIYRDGTIGGAKKHLEKTARDMSARMKASVGGSAFVSVNKGLVTRSSAVIPVIPVYLSILFKVMKEKGTHEGCIEQIERLCAERLFAGKSVPVDADGLIRVDDLEMDDEVQAIVSDRMAAVTEATLPSLGDLEGYRHDFLAANGFDVAGIDYDADVPRMDVI